MIHCSFSEFPYNINIVSLERTHIKSNKTYCYDMVLFLKNEYSAKCSVENVLIRSWWKIGNKKQTKIDKSLIKSILHNKYIKLHKEKIREGYYSVLPFNKPFYEKKIENIDALKNIYIRENLNVYDLAIKFVANKKNKDNQKINKERLIFDTMISQFENKMEYEYPVCYKDIYREIKSLNLYEVSLKEITFLIDDILTFDGSIYNGSIYKFITEVDRKAIRQIKKKLDS